MSYEKSIETSSTVETTEAAPPPRRSRRTPVFVLIGIVSVTGAFLFFLNTGQETDPRVTPDTWETPDLNGAKEIDLDDPDGRRAVVVISADDKTCWNGYIGSRALKSCGASSFTVTGAPDLLGVNAKSTHPDKFFLGLAVWDGEGERMIDSISTKKKFGTVALSVPLSSE